MNVGAARAALAAKPDPELSAALLDARCSLYPAEATARMRELRRQAASRTGSYTGQVSGRKSRGQGADQCEACRRFISNPGESCPGCGFLQGAGYLGVPAQTSYLERWR